MGLIMHDGVPYSGGDGTQAVELTTAQYNALSSAEKHDTSKVYYLTDGQGGGGYTLPIASASTLGGIKVGSGLSIDNSGVLSGNNFELLVEDSKDLADTTWTSLYITITKSFQEMKSKYRFILVSCAFQHSPTTAGSGLTDTLFVDTDNIRGTDVVTTPGQQYYLGAKDFITETENITISGTTICVPRYYGHADVSQFIHSQTSEESFRVSVLRLTDRQHSYTPYSFSGYYLIVKVYGVLK